MRVCELVCVCVGDRKGRMRERVISTTAGGGSRERVIFKMYYFNNYGNQLKKYYLNPTNQMGKEMLNPIQLIK